MEELQVAKAVEGHPDRIVVMYQEDLDKRLEAAHEEAAAALVGTRWGIKDVLKRLGGYSRTDFFKYVLAPKRQELMDIGAVLHWSTGTGDPYRFKATVMAQWLEDNMAQIDGGGWK